MTEIVYVRNPDLTKKALSKQSQSYVIGGNGNNSSKSIQIGWLRTAPLEIIGEP